MRWTDEHDIVFIREIFLHEPYKFKKGSTERGKCWDQLSMALNNIEQPYFKVSQRSVRDHFKTLEDNHKKKRRQEEKASGIDVVDTEVDIGMDDILERFNEADIEHAKETEINKKSKDEDQAKATEMRKRSLETFAETRERNMNDTKSPKRSRNNGSDTINFLKEKSEHELEIRKEENEIKRNEQKNFRDVMASMQQQQQMMMQQQMQQQQMMMALVEKLAKK